MSLISLTIKPYPMKFEAEKVVIIFDLFDLNFYSEIRATKKPLSRN